MTDSAELVGHLRKAAGNHPYVQWWYAKVLTEAADEIQRLRDAIELHHKSVSALGLNVNSRGEHVWGGAYDRELWATAHLADRPERSE